LNRHPSIEFFIHCKGNIMNRKTNPTPKSAAPQQPEDQASAKATKDSRRKPEQKPTPEEQARAFPSCTRHAVQLHQCTGIGLIVLPNNPSSSTDPTFTERFGAALENMQIRVSISTEADVFELALWLVSFESLAERAGLPGLLDPAPDQAQQPKPADPAER
jgi:hypothetical protein